MALLHDLVTRSIGAKEAGEMLGVDYKTLDGRRRV